MKFKLEKDFLDFLDLCNKQGVKYLVIGGYAVSIHGYPRYTKDLDIAIELSDENAVKTATVIQEFGLGSLGLVKDDFLKRNFVTQLGYPPVRIDVLNDIEGVPFLEAWQRRKEVIYEGIIIHFIGYEELLILKRLAGRSQDMTDVKKLMERNKRK